MGLWLMQSDGLWIKVRTRFVPSFYRTLIANLPGTLIPINLATSELAGFSTTTRPVQSSLRFVDLQLGQTGPALIILQFLHAFKTYALL